MEVSIKGSGQGRLQREMMLLAFFLQQVFGGRKMNRYKCPIMVFYLYIKEG